MQSKLLLLNRILQSGERPYRDDSLSTAGFSFPERIDKREYILENYRKIGHSFLFVDGNQPRDLSISMQSSTIAMRSSHVLTLDNSQKTDREYALILEENVFLEDDGVQDLFSRLDQLSELLSENFSILQLETMNFVSRSKIRSAIAICYFQIFRHYRYNKKDLNPMRKLLGTQEFRVLK